MARSEAVAVITLTLSLALSGCSVIADFDQFESPGCDPQEEICDGEDNDCDDRVDEGIDVQTDPNNCGGCGRICVAPENTNPACNAGVCGIGCPSGFDDCDDDASNGCETSLASAENCGACGNACTVGDFCRDGTCVSDCGAGFIECDSVCIAEGAPPECGRCDGGCAFTCGPSPGECVAPVQVATGHRHACAAGEDGSLVCWGMNNSGQLSIVDGVDRPTPVITELSDVTHVAAGFRHTCAILDDGSLSCWGDNVRGQLGAPTTGETSAVPVEVELTGVDHVSTGRLHTCAADGAVVYCWGDDVSGQVTGAADARHFDTPQAVDVPGDGDVVSIAAGGESNTVSHSCVVRVGGEVYCWGDDEHLQTSAGGSIIGDGKIFRITGADGARLVAVGGRHSCAALPSDVVCWGANGVGQQGAGTVGSEGALSMVTSVEGADSWDVVELSTGTNHTCARLSGGEVLCWGSNRYGEMGTGDAASFAPTPVPVAAPATPAAGVAGGGAFTCTIQAATDALFCFGRNDRGQLGKGEIGAIEATPVQVEVPTLP